MSETPQAETASAAVCPECDADLDKVGEEGGTDGLLCRDCDVVWEMFNGGESSE